MEYLALNNGVRMPLVGFGTWTLRGSEGETCVQNPSCKAVLCTGTDDMARSRIRILASEIIEKQKTIDEEDILVVAGRGVRNEKDVEMCRRLAEALGGQLAFTRRSFTLKW